MNKNFLFSTILVLLIISISVALFKKDSYETKRVSIGYQSITAQTWGAVVIKGESLLEKYYKGDKVLDVVWNNFASGPPITSNMIAGKIHFGFMGDMPLLINGDNGQKNDYYNSRLVFLDGQGVDGNNQNIVVLKDSEIISTEDLRGKIVSVPNSSSAHRNLLQELTLAGINYEDVNIVFQDIPTAILLLEKKEIDAIATWEPYPQYLVQERGGRVLDRRDEIKYLAGVVANEDWVSVNNDIYMAFEKALGEAHRLLTEGSDDIIRLVSNETGFSENVVREVIKNIRWESEIYPDDIQALEKDVEFLQANSKLADNFKLDEFIY